LKNEILRQQSMSDREVYSSRASKQSDNKSQKLLKHWLVVVLTLEISEAREPLTATYFSRWPASRNPLMRIQREKKKNVTSNPKTKNPMSFPTKFQSRATAKDDPE